MKKPNTVMDEKSMTEKVTVLYPYSMENERTITFSMQGQTPERSYEDRSVYFEIKTSKLEKEVGHENIDATMWINGEDAIELGTKLINQGNFALKSNMYQHQLIHHKNRLSSFIKDGIVEKIIFELTKYSPNNYGIGFHKFLITPVFSSIPKYESGFCFEDVIYFNADKKSFKKQMNNMIGKTKYEFVNYDYSAEVKEFENRCIRNKESK